MPPLVPVHDAFILSPGDVALAGGEVGATVDLLKEQATSGRSAREAGRRIAIRIPPGFDATSPTVSAWLRALDRAAPWALYFLRDDPSRHEVGAEELVRAVLDGGADRDESALRHGVELAAFAGDRGLPAVEELHRTYALFELEEDADAFAARVREAWREWDESRGLPFQPREVDNPALRAWFEGTTNTLHLPTRGTGAARFLARVPDPYHAFYGSYDLAAETGEDPSQLVVALTVDLQSRGRFVGRFVFRGVEERDRREIEQLLLQPAFDVTVLGNKADGVLVTCFTRSTPWRADGLAALARAWEAATRVGPPVPEEGETFESPSPAAPTEENEPPAGAMHPDAAAWSGPGDDDDPDPGPPRWLVRPPSQREDGAADPTQAGLDDEQDPTEPPVHDDTPGESEAVDSGPPPGETDAGGTSAGDAGPAAPAVDPDLAPPPGWFDEDGGEDEGRVAVPASQAFGVGAWGAGSGPATTAPSPPDGSAPASPPSLQAVAEVETEPGPPWATPRTNPEEVEELRRGLERVRQELAALAIELTSLADLRALADRVRTIEAAERPPAPQPDPGVVRVEQRLDAIDAELRRVRDLAARPPGAAVDAEVSRLKDALARLTAAASAQVSAVPVQVSAVPEGLDDLESRVQALEREGAYVRELVERRLAQAEQRLLDLEAGWVSGGSPAGGPDARGGAGRPWWRFW